MKIIQLEEKQVTVDELMELARDEAVVLRQPDRAMFAIASVDEFEVEVEHLKKQCLIYGFSQGTIPRRGDHFITGIMGGTSIMSR